MQMVGSFCFGVLLDRLGSRGGFVLSFLASAACYTLICFADSIEMLYISKIPTIFQAGFLCAQSAIAETTVNGAERVQALGRLTVAYTIGSVIGPGLGGFLGSSGNYYVGAQVAVAGSLLSALLCLFMSADHVTAKPLKTGLYVSPPATPSSAASEAYGKDGNTVIPPVIELEGPKRQGVLHVIERAWFLLGSKTITSVANSMAAATLPLILKNTYGMQEAGMGAAMSVMSGFNALVNSVFLGPVAEWHGNNLVAVTRNVLLGMTIFYAAQYMCNGLTFAEPFAILNGIYPFLITSIIISMHQYVLSTVITAESTALVDEKEKGTLLGMEHSLFAAARIISPQTGVLVLHSYGAAGVSASCGAVFLAVYATWRMCGTHVERLNTVCHGEKKEK
ncbi:Slc22a18 [Symbiodinium microadriaticum]|nr:Slc22a18 [Symbiodinium microadriaticum]